MPAQSETESQVEQRRLLARRLFLAMVTPIIFLVLLGFILGRQILEMSQDAHWLDHSDQVLSVANNTLREIIDQETGSRGFLLTKKTQFLEPLERAHPRDGFSKLHDLTSDNSTQQERFEEVSRRYEDWVTFNTPRLDPANAEMATSLDSIQEGKRRMDRVRAAMKEAVDSESALRSDRIATAQASLGNTRVLFVSLLVGAAGVMAFLSRRQLSSIAQTFRSALAAETEARQATEAEAWIRSGQTKIVATMQGEQSARVLAEKTLSVIAEYVGADVGAFFTRERGVWKRRAGFALDSKTGSDTFEDGEGLVGRTAKEAKLVHLHDVPADYLKMKSGTGESAPVEIIVLPGSVDDEINCVVELGFLKPVSQRSAELLGRIGESVATAVRSSEHKARLRELLDESQQQAEELQAQQEELRVANEELELQTQTLRSTQSQLETQQAELEQINDNLSQQSQTLDRQNRDLALKQEEISQKAREVERASRFKSEFLSNMSHELRTPLNSSLILAKLLAENREQNLNEEQIKFAETIYSAGNDLLTLINDILDLSKIEAGKMDVHATNVPLDRIRSNLERTFVPLAVDKKIRFSVTIDASAPAAMESDGQRLEQILKNLCSNAIKFTERGEVVVEISAKDERIAFAVRDSGIGIAKAQQRIIFEAFRQADGTTNRKYAGTGLGLSISRELGRLLGGEITVTSEPGKGSTFTLLLPRAYKGPIESLDERSLDLSPGEDVPTNSLRTPRDETPKAPPVVEESAVEPGARVVLLIEDDAPFADILSNVAREAGFTAVVATTAERGFQLAKKHLPTGVILDMKLPDHSGLSVLDRLKRDPVTRHIPVHVISSSDFTETALSMGAAAYLLKPVKREQLVEAFRSLEQRAAHRMRRVLVVDDDERLRESVAKLLGRKDVEISTAADVQSALALLRERTFDCVVTDLGLPDQSGYDLLETMASEEPYSVPPVIVYTGRALTSEEEQRLRKYSKSIIVKGARSPERLLDEVTLFLHQVESELPVDQQKILKQARHRESVFEGRTILVVEDDVRNVFALTSVLEPKGARVAIARNGKEALSALEREKSIDLVLMDIMMPEMDGIEAMTIIRKNPKWARLPIIALTAKAMQDDQERCLAAGANDYMAKPLDIEILLSLLRVWMPKA